MVLNSSIWYEHRLQARLVLAAVLTGDEDDSEDRESTEEFEVLMFSPLNEGKHKRKRKKLERYFWREFSSPAQRARLNWFRKFPRHPASMREVTASTGNCAIIHSSPLRPKTRVSCGQSIVFNGLT